MNHKLFGYKNKFWRTVYDIPYTGQCVPCELEPGEYLLICQGAHGGNGVRNTCNYGGTSIGILNLDETTTLYAVTGGNGGDASTNIEECYGGFNGGGYGGQAYSSTYKNGPGGGGASDIRLLPFDPDEYPTYDEFGNMISPNKTKQVLHDWNYVSTDQESTSSHAYTGVDYIFSLGSSSGPISTGYRPSKTTSFDIDAVIYNHHLTDYQFLCGTRNGGTDNNAMNIHARQNTNDILFYNRCGQYTTPVPNFPYNERIKISCDMYGVSCYLGDTLFHHETIPNPENVTDCAGHFHVNAVNYGTDFTEVSDGSFLYTKIYGLKFYDIKPQYEYQNYQPLAYIESTGDQYIDVGYIHSSTTFFALNYTTLSGLTGNQAALGAGNTDGTRQVTYYMKFNDNQYSLTMGNSTSSANSTTYSTSYNIPQMLNISCMVTASEWFRLEKTTSGSLERLGYAYGAGVATNGGDRSLAVFASHIGDEYLYRAKMRLYSLEIDEDNQTPREKMILYPVKRKSDGAVGLYDKITKQFFANPTNVPFIEGPEDNTVDLGEDECTQIEDQRILIHDFIPVRRHSDNAGGLFDLMDYTFHGPINTSNKWLVGPDKIDTPSLLSRIIVAGGGGGGIQTVSSAVSGDCKTPDHLGFGGGVYGGLALSNTTVESTLTNEPNTRICASQLQGHAFGYGGTPAKSQSSYTGSAEGSGAGGGGWFGGFSTIGQKNSNHLSYNGTGGSGFVYTANSVKLQNYNVPERFQLSDTLMTSGSAIEPHIYICKLESQIFNDDTIEYFTTGDVEHQQLPPGTYRLSCYGGDGGIQRDLLSGDWRGGFSTGDLSIKHETDIFVRVGGSGGPRYISGPVNSISRSWVSATLPTIGYNGGGLPINPSTEKCLAGGGASDIRLHVDDLYHRVIVAGGAGSDGDELKNGGAGGGETGGSPNTIGATGTNYGPGTQTESPTDTSGQGVGGGFGYGGNSIVSNSTYGYGGAGGGGWYGGSGTIPNTYSSTNMGGSGGSGFVWTSSSTVPSDYALSDDEYLTNASTTVSGNPLPIYHSKIEIQCLELYNKFLCMDVEGIKTYDTTLNRWTLIPDQTLSVETINDYGVFEMVSDVGLLNDYQILITDSDIVQVNMEVCPPELTVTATCQEMMSITDIILDTNDSDKHYEIEKVIDRISYGKNGSLKLHLSIEKDVEHPSLKIYNVILRGKHLFDERWNQHPHGMIYGKPKKIEYRDPDDYRDEHGFVTTAQWLLPTNCKSGIPVQYHDFIDPSIFQTSTFSVSRSFICEHNHKLYFAMLFQDNGMKFCLWKYDPYNLTFTYQWNINSSQFATTDIWFTSMLIDDHTIYLSSETSDANNSPYIYKIDRVTKLVTKSAIIPGDTSDDYNKTAFGKLTWLNNTTIGAITKRNIVMYDTIIDRWNVLPIDGLSNNTIGFQTVAFGKQFVLCTYKSNSLNTLLCISLENGSCTTQTLPTSSVSAITYHNGIFYIAQSGVLSTFNEATGVLETLIEDMPWSEPFAILHSDDQDMIFQSGKYAYLYDETKQSYRILYLNLTIPTNVTSYGNVVPFVWNRHFYMSYPNAVIVNLNNENLGPLSRTFSDVIIPYNDQHADMFIFDNRFVTLHDEYMEIHDGIISYDVSETDVSGVYQTTISKSQYSALKNIKFIKDTE